MSRLYDQKIVKHIQNCLNTGNVIIQSIDSYDVLIPGNHFRMGEVELVFIKSTNSKIPGYISSSYMSEKANKDYMADWKLLPVNTHLIKDMKMLKTDMNNEVPYKTFTFTDINGNQKCALVRRLFELEDMDADQPECIEYYEKYTDLIHMDQCYLIIKIIDANDYGYNQKNDIYANKDIDYITVIVANNEKDNYINSEPLF